MQHAFDTDRLRVMVTKVPPGPCDDGEPFLYVAFPKDYAEVPMPFVTVLVHDQFESDEEPKSNWAMVAWVETADQCRRRGFAKEVLYGLLRHFLNGQVPRKLYLTPGTTESGAALVKALYWPHGDDDDLDWSKVPS